MKQNESTPLKEGRTKSTTKPLDTNNMKKYSKEEIQKGFEAWRKDAEEVGRLGIDTRLFAEETDSDVLVTFMENPNHTYSNKKQI